MIVLQRLSKAFDGIPALSDVSLTFAPGQVHGLLGENGAGKSTAMHLLYGLLRRDQGEIIIDGQRAHLRSPRDARRLGIGMVHQHFAMVPTLSLDDNLVLALGRGFGARNHSVLRQRMDDLARRLGWTLAIPGNVGDASVGQQQRLEILKALATGGRTLILDEPTAVLAPPEVDELLAALRTLAAEGRTVILITHKLAEVERCCDTVAILRRGRVVHCGRRAELDAARMAELMVGAPSAPAALRASPIPGEPVLTVSGLRTNVEQPAIDFTVRRGEITAIAGVDGNGQSPLIATLLDQRRPAAGRIDRHRVARTAVIPDDRLRHALISQATVRDNLLLRSQRRRPWVGPGGWLHLRRWTAQAEALVRQFSIHTPSVHLRAGQLSGGNQQKVVVARELAEPTDLVIAVNPTRGLDIAATRFVFDRLIAARDAGAGVLLVHSDLDELLSVADRVLVMHAGALTSSAWPASNRAAIGRLMLGLGEAEG